MAEWFSGSAIDRCGNLRGNNVWMNEQLTHALAKFLPFFNLEVLCVKTDEQTQLGWISANASAVQNMNLSVEDPLGVRFVFLGLDMRTGHNEPLFALDVTGFEDTFASSADPTYSWRNVRDVVMSLGEEPERSAILSQARSMLDWHHRHRFCPGCGSRTAWGDGGYKLKCTNAACVSQSSVQNYTYPRTDPVVIACIYKGDKLLLGRQKRFPPGMYSCIAGFMEPGESIEEAVTREAKEETGIVVLPSRVRYHSSQPWPFPSSIMIGCLAEAESEEILLDAKELEDAKWFTLAQVQESASLSPKNIKTIAQTTGDIPMWLPPRMAIARSLIQAWIKSRLNQPSL
eukprot:GILK01008376.1.p1 GENE.GILK01008376.1~~GILK01008376.1.p1  ORF type:complete len:358 (-),score=47.15 GILK01008376.1:124-1155(-)